MMPTLTVRRGREQRPTSQQQLALALLAEPPALVVTASRPDLGGHSPPRRGGRGPANHAARFAPFLGKAGATGRRQTQGRQRAARHATIGFMLDTYSHVMPGMQEDAAARVASSCSTPGGCDRVVAVRSRRA